MSPRYFLVLAYGLLLSVSYLDNIRGPLLPVITEELGMPYGGSGLFIALGNLSGIAVTLGLLYIFNIFSERSVTLFALLFGCFAIASGVLVQSPVALYGFGTILGMYISYGGAASNVFGMRAESRLSPTQALCSLHAMYGVGSFAAGVCCAWMLKQEFHWTAALLVMIPPMLILATLLTRNSEARSREDKAEVQPIRLSGKQILIIVLFSSYVAAEVTSSMWLSTYLVESVELSEANASWYVSCFFFIMTASRVGAVFLWRPGHTKLWLYGSLVVASVAHLVGQLWWYPALPLVGLVGPFFPLFLAEITQRFPHMWRSLTIWVVLSMQVTLASLHILLGNLTDSWGISAAYTIPAAIFVAAIVLLFVYQSNPPEAPQNPANF